MDTRDVDRLLALSREARWTFPSSMGYPVRRGAEEVWVERVASEREAFAEAARFLVEARDRDAGLELAANVWRAWMLSRDLAGGRAFLAIVLEGDDGRPTRELALALYGDGLMALWLGADEESRLRNEAALAAARAVGDPEALALACLGLSRVAHAAGDSEQARSLAVQAREHARGLSPAMGQGPLHLHAQSLRLAGDYDQAAALFRESLALNRRLNDEGMIIVELTNLGHVEIHRGDVDAAERCFDELAELASGDDPYSVAMARLTKAAVAFARDNREQAATLVAAIDATLAESGTELPSDDRLELDWLRRELAAQ
jgi:tetratricopeptide (TPR) repeat protein